MKRVLVIYNGVCVFCERWVSFVIRHGPDAEIYFATLQEVQLDEILTGKLAGDDSIIVFDTDQQPLFKSDASLAIMAKLRGPYRQIAGLMRLVPRPIRNLVYDFIGRHRYRIFGKREFCVLPDPTLARHLIGALGGPELSYIAALSRGRAKSKFG